MNRDSLLYMGTYGLGELSGLMRGTSRCIVIDSTLVAAMRSDTPGYLGPIKKSGGVRLHGRVHVYSLPPPHTHQCPSLDGLSVPMAPGERCSASVKYRFSSSHGVVKHGKQEI